MPAVVSRQEGSFTFLGTTTTTNITVSSVNTSRSLVYISVRGTGSGGYGLQYYFFTGELTSSTNIALTRGAASVSETCVVNWQLLEFDSTVSIQRGTKVLSAVNNDVTVTSLDTSKSISIANVRTSSAAAGGYSRHFVRDRITSSTNLRINHYIGDANMTCAWQTIEFGSDVSVQQVDGTGSLNPFDVTVTSVDTSKSFVWGSFMSNTGNIDGRDVRSYRLFNSTTVRAEAFGASNSQFYNYYVVEMTTGSVVRGYDFTGAAFMSTAISVTKAESLGHIGGNQTTMGEANTYEDNYNDGGATISVDSDSQVTWQRGKTTYQCSFTWEVINFEEGDEPEPTARRIFLIS
tara:strand:- start:350 stop:1393 length:1044 start_codon:yes stop_codon:yes gene_type:complete